VVRIARLAEGLAGCATSYGWCWRWRLASVVPPADEYFSVSQGVPLMLLRNCVGAMVVLCCVVAGCDAKRQPTTVAPAAVNKPTESVVDTKAATDEMIVMWLNLATQWHRQPGAAHLDAAASLGEWKQGPPELLQTIRGKQSTAKTDGAKVFATRIGNCDFLIAGDDEVGMYCVAATANLDAESIVRQVGQAFDTNEVIIFTEAGVRTRIYSLITGGLPVGVAILRTSVVDAAPTTVLDFISLSAMRATDVKIPPALSRLADLVAKADADDAPSLVALGDAYFKGEFAKPDFKLAVERWRLAAKAGNAAGMHRLGVAYYGGFAVERDRAKAATLFESAASLGDLESQAMIGWMYANGEGVSVDTQRGRKWMERAVEGGHAAAANNLAQLLERSDPESRDQPRILGLLEQSATKGYGIAHVNLGLIYALGRGVQIDYAKAAKHFQAAADQRLTEGEYNLAVLCMEGKGVGRDDRRAYELFLRAAVKGDARAQNNLGFLLTSGRGVPLDYVEGVKWWIIASQSGNSDATANLGDARRALPAHDISEAERRAESFVPEKETAADPLFFPTK
jgi:TPR repeat protein